MDKDHVSTCQASLKSGPRKGQACGAKCKAPALFCGRHAATIPFTVAPPDGSCPLDTLPHHVLQVVMAQVATLPDPRQAYQSLCAVKLVCRAFRDASSGGFETLYERVTTQWQDWPTNQTRHSRQFRELPLIQKLDVVLGVGCMDPACRAPRVTKVHWPIPVRLCKDCFMDACISTWRARVEHGVPDILLQDLDQVSMEGYNPSNRARYRSYTYELVLRRAVEDIMECSLACCSMAFKAAAARESAPDAAALDQMAWQVMGTAEQGCFKPWCPLDPYVKLLQKSPAWQDMMDVEGVPGDAAERDAIIQKARRDVWVHDVRELLPTRIIHADFWVPHSRLRHHAEQVIAAIPDTHFGSAPLLPALSEDWAARAKEEADRLLRAVVGPIVVPAHRARLEADKTAHLKALEVAAKKFLKEQGLTAADVAGVETQCLSQWCEACVEGNYKFVQCHHCTYKGSRQGLKDHSRAKHPECLWARQFSWP
ncbi:hypothetical protein HXX76_014112 [Chlamydomonas incerta]|uniref:Uncharacterized protein n=1 Tax=Chlamydomonas incerta TaxID=51695 RepID=A0A835SMG7_CHLIN|nr:hypothetical protein HXX76_014112 [Chlamydomonas incerta]|eukprot:KAG2424954.1 hypothetical protein HXX76_014112 [Chlamydomonas incerta]